MRHTEWTGKTDGLAWMHRSLVMILKYVNIRIIYIIMGFVIPFYALFRHNEYIATYRYFRVCHRFGIVKSFLYVFKNYFVFGQIIVDRFAAYAGHKFEMSISGYERYESLSAGQESFLMISSHVGNYELAGYSLKSENKSIYALVYAGESETIMRYREIMFKSHNINMIPMSDDMSHLFHINKALIDGDIISMPGDRIFGSQKYIQCNFFGRSAKFPAGPFTLAARKGIPMLAIFVMKTSVWNYRIKIIEIGASADVDTQRQTEKLVSDFATVLEETLKEYPEQWFNYYDFWA